MIQIRLERPSDYAAVEAMTRKAFYNLYVPGCWEHYLVHVMRSHKDFIPELAFVAELDGQIAGNIMYTRATLTGEERVVKEVLTFGPLSVVPEHQRKGFGTALMEHSFQEARRLGYGAVVIFGSPSNYVGRGFQSCKKHNISLENGQYPAAMMVKELSPGALDGRRWIYRESPVMAIDMQEAERYDAALEPMEKRFQPSQEEFYILSHAVLP